MKYLHMSEDKNGVSFFMDGNFPLSVTDFAPPAPELLLSEAMDARRCVFLELPVGWGGPKHPSPKNQIAFCLQGNLKVEAGNGEVREIGPGGIWWMADTNGSGHTTTVVGDISVKLAIVQLE